MASRQSIVDFVVEQMSAAGDITAKKMFGEYGVYCDGKIIGLVCDDDLFVKPTDGGRAYIGKVVEAPPYPSAKPSFKISGDQIEDADWLAGLIKITFDELSAPKKRKPKKKPKK